MFVQIQAYYYYKCLHPHEYFSFSYNFFDTLITSTSHLISHNLYIVGGAFNRASIHSLTLFGLQNIFSFNTRLKLDHFIGNYKNIFKARKRARLSTSDHNIICALPCIYSHTNRCGFIRSSFHTVPI